MTDDPWDRTSAATSEFPREIAPGIHWLGQCLETKSGGKFFHVHLGLFLLTGADKTLLIDTATPQYWDNIERQIEQVLGGRKLDYIFPTHPEVPHVSNIQALLQKYPRARLVGDMRDYHLFFPEYAGRWDHHVAGDEIELGGKRLVFVEAVMKDLPSTLWAYDRTERAMFVSDGFSITHETVDELDQPVHLPGECTQMSSEMREVDMQQAANILRAALHWSKFVPVNRVFANVAALLERYPSRMLCPAHGNVIDNMDIVVPIIRQMHKSAFREAVGDIAGA